jgi:hypothetical protein
LLIKLRYFLPRHCLVNKVPLLEAIAGPDDCSQLCHSPHIVMLRSTTHIYYQVISSDQVPDQHFVSVSAQLWPLLSCRKWNVVPVELGCKASAERTCDVTFYDPDEDGYIAQRIS